MCAAAEIRSYSEEAWCWQAYFSLLDTHPATSSASSKTRAVFAGTSFAAAALLTCLPLSASDSSRSIRSWSWRSAGCRRHWALDAWTRKSPPSCLGLWRPSSRSCPVAQITALGRLSARGREFNLVSSNLVEASNSVLIAKISCQRCELRPVLNLSDTNLNRCPYHRHAKQDQAVHPVIFVSFKDFWVEYATSLTRVQSMLATPTHVDYTVVLILGYDA